MSSFIPSDYKALDLSGDNYLDWAINTSAVLKSRGLGKCIKYGNDTLAFCEPLLHESKKKWEALRFQDYESVDNYHSDLMRITYSLRLCGELVTNEDLLNKTRDTFHSEEVLLSHQAKGFTTYYYLFSYLLDIEQKKQKMMDNIRRFNDIMEIYYEVLDNEMKILEANKATFDKKRSEEDSEWTLMDHEVGLYIE
ncbi:uncharacterized protein LOC125586181 [Brassica napus]|uniref:uncharacterized protein LOC125586181 n=1 Tax=Brassica napus TaxID=3708 RepID=UPI002079321A|nr:uncharacterized protein LOC125586181 [Brassica napus]